MGSTISDMPIKLMAYFRADQINPVEEMVRAILDMQVPIRKYSVYIYKIPAKVLSFSKTWIV